MQYLELIDEVASRTHLPAQTVRLILETMKEVVLEKLLKREDVIFREFGTFRVKSGNNPNTHEKVPTVRFRVAAAVKNLIKKGT